MKLTRVAVFSLLTIWAFIFISCSSTRQEVQLRKQKELEKQKVDELLDKKQQSKGESEDDVLKLLGIESTEKKDSSKVSKSTIPEKEALGTEVRQLESQLQAKESQIQQLRSELEEKNKKLSELESVLADLKSTTRRPVENPPATAAVSLVEYQRRYQAALNEYKNRNFNTAIRDFQELLRIDSNNSYSDNCQYWIGECYYAMMMYEQALTEFEKVFSFVNSNKEDDAQLKIALCYLNLNKKAQAKSALQKLIMKYPNSEYVSKARQLMQEL